MPYPTVVAGQTITASWGNIVRDQMITPFATASARSSAVTVPLLGMLTHRADAGPTGDWEGWDGSAYRPIRRAPTAIAERTTDQTITTGTNTYVTFDSEIADNAAMFAPTSDTITIREDGLYLVVAGGVWVSNATGVRLITLRQNGTDIPGAYQMVPGTIGGSGYMHATTVIKAVNTDTVKMNVLQTSGGDLVIAGNRMSVVRVSGT